MATEGDTWLIYTRGAFSPEQFDTDAAQWGCATGATTTTERFGIMRVTKATCPVP